MEQNKPRPPATHTRVNAQGLIEVIDLHTGRILCIERSVSNRYLEQKFEAFLRLETPEGVVYLDRTLDPGKVLKTLQVPYSASWGDLIAEKMLSQEGASPSLAKAAQSLGLPYAIVCKWRREYPEFKQALDAARKDRAELLADEATTAAREATSFTDKETKIKVQALQWEAERSDPERFGTKKQVDHKHEGSVTFMLDTGIRRAGDQGYKAVELKDVTPEAASAQESLGSEESERKTVTGGDGEKGLLETFRADESAATAHTQGMAGPEVLPLEKKPSAVHLGETVPMEARAPMWDLREFD